jgi:hypothetical protein
MNGESVEDDSLLFQLEGYSNVDRRRSVDVAEGVWDTVCAKAAASADEVTSKEMIGPSLMHVLVIYMHVRTLTNPYDSIAISK